jgi:hypothetical protein
MTLPSDNLHHQTACNAPQAPTQDAQRTLRALSSDYRQCAECGHPASNFNIRNGVHHSVQPHPDRTDDAASTPPTCNKPSHVCPCRASAAGCARGSGSLSHARYRLMQSMINVGTGKLAVDRSIAMRANGAVLPQRRDPQPMPPQRSRRPLPQCLWVPVAGATRKGPHRRPDSGRRCTAPSLHQTALILQPCVWI